ncbi:hypothetical protein KAR91_65190 [Candidatus Pacearchaeota archaeon]|nr:hypothetical protein [Candidatus Pacearchaeota archaeon]
MASIDKIYGTQAQYEEFAEWCRQNDRSLLKNFYPIHSSMPEEKHRAISNFTTEQDDYLKENCPLQWVRERLAEQYNDFAE